MKFKLDENLAQDAVEIFQSRGHETDNVRKEGLDGSDDGIIFRICQREERILITLDLDFANPYEFPAETCAGIVVLRPSIPSRKRIAVLLNRLIQALEVEPIAGRLWIVDESRIRIRGDL